MAAKREQQVKIAPIEICEFPITIVGTTPLITHQRHSLPPLPSARKGPKPPRRTPEEEYERSIYRTVDGLPGFPANGIKRACVDVCHTFLTHLPKTWARGAFFIMGEILPIVGEPRMRHDICTIGRQVPDDRYRAEFPEWSIPFTIRHNPYVASAEAICNLVENAGFYIGIGDWRPQRGGQFGMFAVRAK